MIKIISWFGTALSIAGAFLVANLVALPGYACFTLGSLAWLAVAIHKKDYSLFTLNGAFLLANIIGLNNSL